MYDKQNKKCHTIFKFNDADIYGLTYNSVIWNILTAHLKLKMSDILTPIEIKESIDQYSKNQIYRLTQMGDYILCFKLYLYSSSNCESLNITNDKFFSKEPIYNLEYYKSSNFLKLKLIKPDDDQYDINSGTYSNEDNEHISTNHKIGNIIYSNKFLEEIKNIRSFAFEHLENYINTEMIPIAYDKNGLFWKPEIY